MHTVQYGNQVIIYNLRRVDRKTLAIEVHPDLSVWVIAPPKFTTDEIDAVVLKRCKWILKQRIYFQQFLPRTPEREYVSGETHLYLGRRYILKVKKSSIESVKLIGGNLIVSSRDPLSTYKTHDLLAGWYYRHAQRKFEFELNSALKKFRRYKIGSPPTEIRRMKNRWGSCTPNGRIILNPELIKTSGNCIQYVIVHELCHLVHPDHSKEFFELQSTIMPDWERWKEKLERVLA